jgi:hypothetical protein
MEGRFSGEPERRLRGEAEQRSAERGPLIAIAGLVRGYGLLAEDLLEVLRDLPYQLDLLDARLRLVCGERWWDEMFEALRRQEGGDHG